MTLERCPWYVAGPLLGLLIVAFRAALNKPLGALGGYIDLAENVVSPRRLGLRAFAILGFVAGGALFAITLGNFSPSLSYGAAGEFWPVSPPAQLAVLLVGGIVMGVGARIAGGCTSGHGMTGMSLGSPASVVASMTFFATAVALTHVTASVLEGR